MRHRMRLGSSDLVQHEDEGPEISPKISLLGSLGHQRMQGCLKCRNAACFREGLESKLQGSHCSFACFVCLRTCLIISVSPCSEGGVS